MTKKKKLEEKKCDFCDAPAVGIADSVNYVCAECASKWG